MNNLQQNLSHMIVAVVVIAAAAVLCVTGHITGDAAVGMILAAGGFSLGAGSASVGTTTVAVSPPAASVSSTGQTTVQMLPEHQIPPQATPNPTPPVS